MDVIGEVGCQRYLRAGDHRPGKHGDGVEARVGAGQEPHHGGIPAFVGDDTQLHRRAARCAEAKPQPLLVEDPGYQRQAVDRHPDRVRDLGRVERYRPDLPVGPEQEQFTPCGRVVRRSRRVANHGVHVEYVDGDRLREERTGPVHPQLNVGAVDVLDDRVRAARVEVDRQRIEADHGAHVHRVRAPGKQELRSRPVWRESGNRRVELDRIEGRVEHEHVLFRT